MKNLVKALFVFAVSAFVLTSCNKEKAAVNKLDGAWTLSSSTVSEEGVDCSGGVTAPTTTTVFNFNAYTVGEEESGQLIATVSIDTVSFSDTTTYAVSENGKELTVGTGTDAEVWTINTLSKSSLEVERTADEDVLTACPDSTNNYTAGYTNMSVTTTLSFDKQ